MSEERTSTAAATAVTCSPLKCIYCKHILPQRYVMTSLILFGIMIAYAQRVCLSIAINAMVVADVHLGSERRSHNADECFPKINGSGTVIYGRQYEWDDTTKSVMLSSFYIGYTIFAIPSGLLCDWFGAKWIIFTGMSISSLATLMIPLSLEYLPWGVAAGLRVISGLSQAPVYPGVTQLLCRWVPPSELGRVGGMAMSANMLGIVFGNILSGYVIEASGEWIVVFLGWGIFGLIWAFFFWLYVYSIPALHPHISPPELEFLTEKIPTKVKLPVPWKRLLTDIVIWSLVINQFVNDYTLFTIITDLPIYMNDILSYNISTNGVLSSLPPLACFICSLILGYITDMMINRFGVRVVYMRMIMTSLGTVGPPLFLCFAVWAKCQRSIAITCFTLGLAFKGGFYCGAKISIVDLTKNFTGLVAAIVNCSGAVAGIIAPLVVGVIARKHTFLEWSLVFYISLAVAIIGCIIYCLFAKADRARWDYPEGESGDDGDNTTKKPFYHFLSCYHPV